MALFLGRFERYVIDAEGDAVSGASVYVRRQGATVSGDQSGSGTWAVTVNHQGGIRVSDTVAVNNGTTTYPVTAVTATTVTITGTLSLSDDDRLVPTNGPPTLYNDPVAGESLAHPLTTSSLGLAAGWVTRGFYDVLVQNGSSYTLIQDHYVGGGELQMALDQAPWYCKFDGSTDDTTSLQAAIDYAATAGGASQGTTLIAPAGTCIISSTVTLKNRVRLLGQGSRNTTFKAAAGFSFNGTTDAMFRIGAAGTDCFGARLEHLEIDCNNVANSIGIYSTDCQEGSGPYHVLVTNFKVKGLFFSTSGCQNWGIRNFNTAHTSTTAIGIDINASGSRNLIEDVTCNSNNATQSSNPGIRITDSNVTTLSTHYEYHDTGVNYASGATGVCIGAYGHSTLVTVVKIDQAGVLVFDATQASATNLINDTTSGGAGTFSGNGGGFYFCTNDGSAGAKTILSSEDSALSRMNSHFKFTNAVNLNDITTVASAATINPDAQVGNFWNITGTTTITAITPSSLNKGRIIVMKFASAGCQVTDNGTTLDLNGNFVSAAGAILVVISDGTNVSELARSQGVYPRATAHAATDWNTTVGTEGAITTGSTDTRGSIVMTSTAGGAFTTALTFKDGTYGSAPHVQYTIHHTSGPVLSDAWDESSTVTATTWTLAVTSAGDTTVFLVTWFIIP